MRRGASGQASIELVGALPVVLAIVFGIVQLLAFGVARAAAGGAAEAGAMALVQGGDAARAARAAAPGWSRARLQVVVEGRRVRARIVPLKVVPGLRLVARASADAGPRS